MVQLNGVSSDSGDFQATRSKVEICKFSGFGFVFLEHGGSLAFTIKDFRLGNFCALHSLFGRRDRGALGLVACAFVILELHSHTGRTTVEG